MTLPVHSVTCLAQHGMTDICLVTCRAPSAMCHQHVMAWLLPMAHAACMSFPGVVTVAK